MGNSLIKIATDFKSDPVNLDYTLYLGAIEMAKGKYKDLLTWLDNEIKARRDKRFTIIRMDKTWYTTMLGPVRIKRRYYRAPDGSCHYLLDELVGMGKHRHTSRHVQKMVLETVVQLPFRRSTQTLASLTPVDLSHQTIYRIAGEKIDEFLKTHNKAVRHLEATGELDWGEGRKTCQLLIEADGVMIPLQGEESRKAEAKLGISYEGHQKVGRDRYKTMGKVMYADITSGSAFWTAMTLKLNGKYDLSETDTILGGDGAGWIRQGADCFDASYQLCRFHLNKSIAGTLGYDRDLLKKVKEALRQGDITLARGLLEEEACTATGDRRKDLTRLAGYIRANASGITPYTASIGTSRGTGAIEGNIDKVIVRRMKNQGMSWSIKGARRMLCLRVLWYEGRIGESLAYNPPPRPYRLPEKRVRNIIDKKINTDYGKYFSAGVPALMGPHSQRPWAKVLKSVTGGL